MTAAGHRVITTDDAANLAEEILSANRARPIVAITTHHASGEPWIDPAELAAELASSADVVVIETGDATWELSAALPDKFDVYGGAVRVWFPGTSAQSDLKDHPLLFIYSDADAAGVRSRVLRLVLGKDAPGSSVDTKAVLRAVVTSVVGTRVEIDADGQVGLLKFADLPLAAVAQQLKGGVRLRVRHHHSSTPERPVFTNEGLLAKPWHRIRAEYRVGDVVTGRVVHIADRFLLVELLPDAAGIVPIAEIDYEYVKNPADFAAVGDIVTVQIRDLDPSAKRCTLSIKRAHGTEPRPTASYFAGGNPYEWDSPEQSPSEDAAASDARIDELESELHQVRAELQAANDDRQGLIKRLKEQRSAASDAKKDARSAHDRYDALERRVRGQLDPTASSRAFLTAVRVEYAKAFGETDRQQYPLAKMRVGGEFLDRLKALQGVSVEKVVEVCAQVAAGRAHEVPAREVHQLRTGEGGAPARRRGADDAVAWRCSLQDNSASARRLHWWAIAGRDGAVVEFASVGVHDDMSIPS